MNVTIYYTQTYKIKNLFMLCHRYKKIFLFYKTIPKLIKF